MVDFIKAAGEMKKGLVVLQDTSDLTTACPKEAVWEDLKQQYDAAPNDPIARVSISVANAILTHERIFFGLTRDKTRDLVKADPNWSGGGIANDKWTSVIALLTGPSKFIREAVKGDKKRMSVYEVMDEHYRTYLAGKGVDSEKQRLELKSFTQNEYANGKSADQMPDLEGRSKNEEVRTQGESFNEQLDSAVGMPTVFDKSFLRVKIDGSTVSPTPVPLAPFKAQLEMILTKKISNSDDTLLRSLLERMDSGLSLSDKQRTLIEAKAKVYLKPKLTLGEAEKILNQTAPLGEIIRALREYDFSKSKEGLAIALMASKLQGSEKNDVANALGLTPPKKL